jgi:hypothetical protein
MKTLINKDEHIVTAYAEYACGPGWSNTPLWVVVRKMDNTFRLVCLQPEDQTETMRTLFDISASVNIDMVNECKKLVK